jgi:hypothetical protein
MPTMPTMPTALIAMNPRPKKASLMMKQNPAKSRRRTKRKNPHAVTHQVRQLANPYAVTHQVRRRAKKNPRAMKRRKNPAAALLSALLPQTPGAAVGVASAYGLTGADGSYRQIGTGAAIVAASLALANMGRRDWAIGVGSAGMVVLGAALVHRFMPGNAVAPKAPVSGDLGAYVPQMGDVVEMGGQYLIADGRGGYIGTTADPARIVDLQGFGAYSNV